MLACVPANLGKNNVANLRMKIHDVRPQVTASIMQGVFDGVASFPVLIRVRSRDVVKHVAPTLDQSINRASKLKEKKR